jgi:hypothetical protein
VNDHLRGEVLAIIDQLSPDELRVFRFMGRRMIDIGHVKYGALDLSLDRRSWTTEIAEEASDKLFYEQCRDIAKADARAERVNRFRTCDEMERAECEVADRVMSAMEPLREVAGFIVEAGDLEEVAGG